MTPKDFELLDKKYGKLVYYAASKIYLDKASTIEDYVQSIWLNVIKKAERYMPEWNITSIEELINTKDNCVKTWIWSQRYTEGTLNSRKRAIRNGLSLDQLLHPIKNNHVILDDYNNWENIDFDAKILHEIEEKIETRAEQEDRSFVNNITKSINKSAIAKIKAAIIRDPECYKENGTLNVLALSRITGISLLQVKKILNTIREEYEA